MSSLDNVTGTLETSGRNVNVSNRVTNVSEPISFGVNRLVSKSDDEEEPTNNNNNAQYKEEGVSYFSGDDRTSPRNDSTWGQSPGRPSSGTSPELEVDSPAHSRTNSPSIR